MPHFFPMKGLHGVGQDFSLPKYQSTLYKGEWIFLTFRFEAEKVPPESAATQETPLAEGFTRRVL